MLARRIARQQEEITVEAVTDAAGLSAVQAAVERVQVDASVGRYCVALVEATRAHPDVLIGASPRGSLGLVLAARGWALIRGRDYVIPEDVKAVAPSVLAHRITVKPELWMTHASGAVVVKAVLSGVRAPERWSDHDRVGTHARPRPGHRGGGGGLVGAALIGSPVLVVLAASFVLPVLMGLLGRPDVDPRVVPRLGLTRPHEGQGTTSTLEIVDGDAAERSRGSRSGRRTSQPRPPPARSLCRWTRRGSWRPASSRSPRGGGADATSATSRWR
ncbi:MAG: ATPase associated with various cellular, 3 [Nocardioides sp.]|uniref:AAA family ATPase n=1 Tax=Nocardioides sp. TaxID=35761 RepID=UPI0026360DA2|nr:MoxR family ATPase [Nocardioides sp.]MCW2833768.1 ATPase associated with various cellular, 3 [Nocardioides sp.]